MGKQHDDRFLSCLFQETPCHPLDSPSRWRVIGEGRLNTKYGTLTATGWAQRLRVRRPALSTTPLDFLRVKAVAGRQGQGCHQTSPGIPKWGSTARLGQCHPSPTPLGECRNSFPEREHPLLPGLFEDRQGRRDRTGGDPTADRRERGRLGLEAANPPLLERRRRRRLRHRDWHPGWAVSLRLFPFLLRPECLPEEVATSPEAPSAADRLTPTR